MVPYDQMSNYPIVAKVPFLFPIEVRDGTPKAQVPKSFLMLFKKVLRTYSAQTEFLLKKLKGSFRKVQFLLVENPSKIRVEYSPISGVIALNTNKNLSIRAKREGVVSNTLFALGMAYYDFGLSNADRLYWRSLLRGGDPVPVSELNKSLSFSVESAGKQRLAFAGGFVRHFLSKPNETFERFFSDSEVTEYQLPSDRFQGLGLRSLRGVVFEMGGGTLSVKEVLDLAGVTSLTSDFRAIGGTFDLDVDENQGIVELGISVRGEKVITMKRILKGNIVENDKFFIAPQYQGKGFGLRAFSVQVDQAIEKGVTAIRTLAERNDAGGTVGYDVWWKFGYDGQISPSNTRNPSQAEAFIRQAAIESVSLASEMTVKRQFYDLLIQLKEAVETQNYSRGAYEYLLKQTLGGRYSDIKTDISQAVPREDLLKLMYFFNQAFPTHRILIQNGLSFKSQSMQRLLELEGFEEFWTEYGKGWQATADLREGADSPTVAILSNYVRNRTAAQKGVVLTETGGDFNKEALMVISSIRSSLLKPKTLQGRVANNYVFKTKNTVRHA